MVVAGGMESMSNCPYLLPKAREGFRLGHGELVDSMIHDGLWDAYEDYHMGCTGEIVAEKYGCDTPAAGRVRAREPPEGDRGDPGRQVQGRDRARVSIPQRKGDPVPFARWTKTPREDTSLEALAKLKPAFKEGGTVTAGNSPGVNDGAAALVVTSAATARALAASRWPASWPRPSRASSRRWS